MSDLNYRRSVFVYESARLQAIAVNAPVIPKLWDEREEPFRQQFLAVIERQCGPHRSTSAAELHGSWMQAYFAMGWKFGEIYDSQAKTHPDLIPFDQLEKREQAKDAVFIALCEIARNWIVDPL